MKRWLIAVVMVVVLLGISGCEQPKEEQAIDAVHRGEAYFNKGEFDKAIADFTEAIRLNPEYDLAYIVRGLAYSEKGEHGRAITDYTDAIALDPKLPDAYALRGQAYEKQGDQAKAEADFAKAKELGYIPPE